MRWLLKLFFPIYSLGGGGGGQTTSTNVNYSPEEAAMRALLMRQGLDIYNQQSGGGTGGGAVFDEASYNAAVENWRRTNNDYHSTPPINRNDYVRAGTGGPGGGGTPAYPGARPITPSAETLSSREQLRQFVAQHGQGVTDLSMGALQFGLKDVLDPTKSPGFQATLDTATRKVGEAYENPGGVLANIRSSFGEGASAGQSSREAIAGGLAGQGYLNTIGDVTGKLSSDAYARGLDVFKSTMANAPNMYNLATQPAVTLGAVGEAVTGDEREAEAFRAAERGWNINAPWLQLQNLAQIVHGTTSPGSTTTGSPPGVTPQQRLGGMMGGAAMGYQMSGSPYGAAAGAAIGLLMSYQ